MNNFDEEQRLKDLVTFIEATLDYLETHKRMIENENYAYGLMEEIVSRLRGIERGDYNFLNEFNINFRPYLLANQFTALDVIRVTISVLNKSLKG